MANLDQVISWDVMHPIAIARSVCQSVIILGYDTTDGAR